MSCCEICLSNKCVQCAFAETEIRLKYNLSEFLLPYSTVWNTAEISSCLKWSICLSMSSVQVYHYFVVCADVWRKNPPITYGSGRPSMTTQPRVQITGLCDVTQSSHWMTQRHSHSVFTHTRTRQCMHCSLSDIAVTLAEALVVVVEFCIFFFYSRKQVPYINCFLNLSEV